MKARIVGCLLVLSILVIGLCGCSSDGSSGSALGIGGGTGSQTPVFTQADLTGTWDLMQFKTSSQQQGGGWMRGVVRFDASGHMFIDDNTTFQSTAADDSFPQGDSGWIHSINSAGVVSVTGGPPEMGTFRGNMASNKQLIVGGVTLSQTDRAIQILRKRVQGVTYSSADLNNKSVESQVLLTGGAPEWERGNGTIGSDGSLTIANSYDSSGRHDTNIDNAARYSITGDGIVTDALGPTFKGFLTPDKKILIATGTDPRSPSVTNYYLFILSISGQTFAQSDLAGTWNFYEINCGTGAEWGYGSLTVNASGNATLTLAARSDNGSLTPVTDNLSLGPSGILVPTADPTSAFQGVMSYNKDFVFVTDTGQSGGVFTMSILTK